MTTAVTTAVTTSGTPRPAGASAGASGTGGATREIASVSVRLPGHAREVAARTAAAAAAAAAASSGPGAPEGGEPAEPMTMPMPIGDADRRSAPSKPAAGLAGRPGRKGEAPAAAAPVRKITVLYVAHRGAIGEAEGALLRAVRELDTAAFRPLALLGEAGPLVAELRQAGVETFVLPLPAAARTLGRAEMTPGGLLKNLGAVRALLGYAADVARWARRQGADVIHSATLQADLYGGLAARVAGVPAVWSVLDPLGPADLSRPGAVLFRGLARRLPSAVICGSRAAAEALGPAAERSGKVRVVYPGLSREEVVSGTVLAALRYSPSSVLAVPFGEALQVGLLATGTDAEREEALARFRAAEEEVARDRQGRSRASLPPPEVRFRHLRAPDLASGGADALRDLHLLVISGGGGAGATSALQAMATGLPVIAVGSGAAEVVAEGENGLTVAAGDVPGTAAAICRLLDNPGLRSSLGRQAHANVSRNHRTTDAARALEEAYRAATAGRRPRRAAASAATT